MTDAYSLGVKAGEQEFDTRKSVPNPFAYGTKEHDDFELGWSDGYNTSIDNFQETW